MTEAFENNKGEKKTNSKEVEEATKQLLNQVKGFEEDRIELAKHSAKTAWKVATGFGLIAFVAVVAVIFLTPLKTVEPYLLKVDNKTGHTEIVKPLSDGETVTYGEVLDKYWIKTYTIARNSYEWESIQTNYNTVLMMSSDKVFSTYRKGITQENKQSPVIVFKNINSVEIKIRSIKFLPTSNDEQKVATVQFSREVKNREGDPAVGYTKTIWEATITFDYTAEIKTEAEEQLNPLRFNVTSYREDSVNE